MRLALVPLVLVIAACGIGGNGGGGTGPEYPLRVSANSRYLVDQNNESFLLIGDAPQSLMVNAPPDDVDLYLADRASRGFNVVWVNLLCAEYTGGRSDASTFDGLRPFLLTGDLSTPNELYFNRCDAVIRSAADHGIAVLLDPAETGSFLSVLRANGLEKCRAYGRYVGKRYRDFDNIIWMSGNDFQSWRDESDNLLVKAVAAGIKETDPRHIQTLGLDYFVSSSSDNALWSDLIDLNAAYTYYPAYVEVLEDYARAPAAPVFLIETDYEFENGADAERLRRQAYWAFLSGACGYVYGNGFIWPLTPGWKGYLETTGAIELGHCRALFDSLAWHTLAPDASHRLVTAGRGTYWSGGTPSYGISENDYVAAASTPDGRLALAYVPSARTVTVDLSVLAGPVTARWFDPTTGTYVAIAGSPMPNSGPWSFTTPGLHADGAGDWILVLDAQ